MAEVKWIKITTDIFDDEKILLIESLPDAYAIITVWFKLLCLAGKMNNSGVFMMNNQIAYTEQMLATIFRMKETTVSLALQTFEHFGMVEIVDGVITIPNWNKHQSLDTYEKKKERDRLYQAERRVNQRALIGKSSDNRLTSDDTSVEQSSDVGVSDIEEEREEDKKKNKSVRENTHSLFNRLVSDFMFSSELTEKVSDWIQYKVERKEPYKEQGLKSLLKQIENNSIVYGDDAVINLIDECMASNWKGIIFDRLEKSSSRNQQKGRLDWIDDI